MSDDNNKNDQTKSDLTRIEDLDEYIHEEDPELDSLFDQETNDSDTTQNSLEETPPPLPSDEEDSFKTDDISPEFDDETQSSILEEMRNELTGISNTEDLQEDEELEDDTDEHKLPEEFLSIPPQDVQDFQDVQDDHLQENHLDQNPDIDPDNYNNHDEPEEYDEYQDDVQEEQQHQDQALPEHELEIEEETTHSYEPVVNKLPPANINKVSPEDFSDVRNFAESLTFGQVRIGGNPAFSVKLSGIYKNSQEQVKQVLHNHQLIDDERSIDIALDLGELLIAQISEYSAVYLASKLKHMAKEISIDLAEEIHRSDSYESNNKGLTNKNSIFQNREFNYDKKKNVLNTDSIKIFTSENIANKSVLENIGFVHEEIKVDQEDYHRYDQQKDHLKNELILKVKKQALELGANAIISSVFQLHDSEEKESIYLSLQGDAVIIDDNNEE